MIKRRVLQGGFDRSSHMRCSGSTYRAEDRSLLDSRLDTAIDTEVSSTLHAVLRAQFAPQVVDWRDSNVIFGAQMNAARDAAGCCPTTTGAPRVRKRAWARLAPATARARCR